MVVRGWKSISEMAIFERARTLRATFVLFAILSVITVALTTAILQSGSARAQYNLGAFWRQASTTPKKYFAKVTSDYASSCMIYDGSVQCSGSESSGMLGNGNTSNIQSTMVQVTGLTSGATSIDAGHDQFCAVVSGAVKCWGNGGAGTLGDGTATSSATPVTAIASGATKVSLGVRTACALVGDKVSCWGSNGNGQVGNNTVTQQNSPVEVISSGATDVSVGFNYACAVVSGGVQCWGDNSDGNLGDNTTTQRQVPTSASVLTAGSNVTRVFAGDYSTCAITSAGGLYCWGYNGNGNYGDGTTTRSLVPKSISGFTSGVTSVSKTSNTTCVVKSGALYCAGQNIDGTLGTGAFSMTVVSTFTAVSAFSSGVDELSEGLYWSHCLTKTDTSTNPIYCWGSDRWGEFGDGTKASVPVAVTSTKFPSGIAAYAISDDRAFEETRSCALYTDGSVKCFGVGNDASAAQLGLGSENYAVRSDPTAVATLGAGSGAIKIAAGPALACAVLSSGAAKCWGEYVVGDGTTNQQSTPVTPTGLSTGVTDVSISRWTSSSSMTTTCVVQSQGVKCWGGNDYGQVGVTAGSDVLSPSTVFSPVPSGSPSPVTQVSVGRNAACAVVGGAVKCWGRGTTGVLGDGLATNSATPVTAIASGATQVSVGYDHACALLSTGGLKCWGVNGYGQVGDNTIVQKNSPVDVSGLTSGVSFVSAGKYYTCAILTTGKVKCWGRNLYGAPGDGTYNNRSTPVDVFGMDSMAFLATEETTCGVTTGGALFCMGSNRNANLTLDHIVATTTAVQPIPASEPSELRLSGPATSTVNTCSTAFTITLKNSATTTTPAIVDTVVTLGEARSGAFYSNSGCTTAITTLTITSGSSTGTFYYKGTAVQKVGLTARASRFRIGAIAHTVQ